MLGFLGGPRTILLWTGGFGSGKSWGLACSILILAIANPGCLGIVAGRSLNLHRRGMLKRFFQVCNKFRKATGIEPIEKKLLGQQIVITIIGGCEVHFLGEDSVTLDRSVDAAFVVIDELSKFASPVEVLDEAIGRVRDPAAKIRKVLAGTNSDMGYTGFIKDHLEKIEQGDIDRHYITSPSSENSEGLDDGYIRRLTAGLSKSKVLSLTEDILDRGMDVVFREYDPEKHVRDWDPEKTAFNKWNGIATSALPWYIGADPNNSVGFVVGQGFSLLPSGHYHHPSYCKQTSQECVIIIDQDVSYYSHEDKEVAALISLIRKWRAMFKCNPSFIAVDKARPDFRKKVAKELGFEVPTWYAKTVIQELIEPGLDIIRQWLDPLDRDDWPGKIPPPRLYFSSSLRQVPQELDDRGLLKQMLWYRYPIDSTGTIRKDRGPIKDGKEDVIDGLRYLMKKLTGDVSFRQDYSQTKKHWTQEPQ